MGKDKKFRVLGFTKDRYEFRQCFVCKCVPREAMISVHTAESDEIREGNVE